MCVGRRTDREQRFLERCRQFLTAVAFTVEIPDRTVVVDDALDREVVVIAFDRFLDAVVRDIEFDSVTLGQSNQGCLETWPKRSAQIRERAEAVME